MSVNIFQIWKIENFSCWNRDVHGKCIKSPSLLFSSCKYMELYPKGISGIDEHLVVRFCDIQKGFSGGKLSFICSDGSILCTLQVNRINTNNVLSPLGPKNEDVIAQIRTKEAENGNQFTLQFIPPGGKIFEQRMCTDIDVSKIPLEIDKNLIESIKLDELKIVLLISYEVGEEKIYFKIARKKGGIQLILEPHSKDEKPVLVESCMRLLSNNNALIRYEVNKHVFQCKKPWTFSDSLKFEEFVDEGRALSICFKIVKGDLRKRYDSLSYCSTGITIGQNTHVCVPEEKSSKGLKSLSSKQIGDPMTKPTTKNDSTSNLTEYSVSVLAKELMCLYQDQDFSDLQLNCGTVSFPVHKNILCARSPVFKRMLSNDMREAASGTVDIEDLDPSTLSHFLAFLYTGTVDDLHSESALKLYYAADKYQVPTLKVMCAAFLSANVSIWNVCDVLSLADGHQDAVLLSVAREFILNNLNVVSRSEEWKRFMKSQPLLAVETMTYFTAKDFVKKCDPQ